MSHPAHLLDRYEIHERIGRGGMGEVLRATHRASGEVVAIKALPLELAPDAAQVERFLREGEALRRLSHPNIVKCRESFEREGRFYLILDYVAGGSLRDQLLTRGSLEISEAVDLMLDVADALTRAHRLQIVHRDLKPDNILVGADGHAHLTDFGVAHLGGAWTPLTMTGMALGTVNYMSPEACQGKPATVSQDIWSFGATLYELLGGQPPFPGSAPGQVILSILTGAPAPMVRALPEDLQKLLDRLLAKDPLDRPASMREVALEMERLVGPGQVRQAVAVVAAAEPEPAEVLPGYCVNLACGEILWNQGDPSDYVAYLEEGELEVIGISSEGGTVVFTVLRRGEMLGEMSCLDGKAHSATVRARGAVRVRRLGRNEFLQWIRSDPERMQKLLVMQSERLRRVAGRLMHSRGTLKSRLIHRLLESEKDELFLTRRDLAGELGVQVGSLSRVVSQLAGLGCLQSTRQSLRIVSREKLQALLECADRALPGGASLPLRCSTD